MAFASVRRLIIKISLLCLDLSVGLLAQTSWVQRFPLNAPGIRAFHAVATADGEGRLFVHGGRRPVSNSAYSDLWQWSGGAWTQMPTSIPLTRWGHAIAFDVARQRLVCFGGAANATSAINGETWLWDGQNWMMSASAGPVARYGHSIVYDSIRQRCVMFGGYGVSGLLGDTWEWDGSLWLPRFGPVNPPARGGHGMAYDSVRRRVVLFGGAVANGQASDTWEFDGVAWVGLAASGAPPREQMGMCFDKQWRKVVVCGGYVAGGGVLSDTWTWDGNIWMQHQTSVAAPASLGCGLAYDDGEAASVLFGGYSGGFYLGGTWTLEGTAAAAAPFGLGCGAPPLEVHANMQQIPVVGTLAGVEVLNAPLGFAFLAIGSSRAAYSGYPLPLSLTSFGMSGCDILQSNDIESARFMPQSWPSGASLQIAIPNVPAFVGVHLYLQAWTGAPGVNAAGFIVSNGLDWKIGNT